MPPQPIGLHEIIEGARKRAVLSMDEKCDYGVGIEAGFVLINNEAVSTLKLHILSRKRRLLYRVFTIIPNTEKYV